MTYEQALAIVGKYMAEKHPDAMMHQLNPKTSYWGPVHERWELYSSPYNRAVFKRYPFDYKMQAFQFMMPESESEFLTLMSILDN